MGGGGRVAIEEKSMTEAGDIVAPQLGRLRWRFEQDGQDVSSDLEHFGKMIGLLGAAPDRVSALLLLQLYGGARSGTLNPAKVVQEICILEGLHGEPSSLKPATQFKRAQLGGLWHKHYLEDGIVAMALNLQKELRKNGLPALKRKVEEAQASGEERYFTADDLAAATYEATHGAWERLQTERRITGEWIIYAVHDGKNYYLSLGKHTDGDNVLRTQLEIFTRHEFPFIAEQLAPLEDLPCISC